MATQLIKEFEKFSGKDAKLQEIFVYANISRSKKEYVPLSNLRVYINDTTFRKLKSIKDFENILTQQKRTGISLLYVIDSKHADNVILSSFVPNDSELMEKNISMPDLYVSDSINGVKEDGDVDLVQYGLKRAVEINKSETFNNSDPYVYVELANDSNMKFVKKDDIGYYEGSKFISLEDIIVADRGADVLAIIQDKDLYTRDNNYVTKIFTSATCSIGRVKAKEEIDVANLKIHSFSLDSNGAIIEEVKDIDSHYSEQFTHKEDDNVYLDTINYQTNRDDNGNFIKVKFKGYDVETLVDISSLHEITKSGEVGKQINKREFLDNKYKYIGLSLFYVVPDSDIKMEIQPLTIEEVSLSYDYIKTMEVTNNEDDILKDGTYLRLKDGRYIEENKSVRPNCYEFIAFEETDFDAYFVLLEPTSEQKGLIVDKSAFVSKSLVNFNGHELKLSNAVKIRLSAKPMNECDVVQTSSTSQKVETCEILTKLSLNDDGSIFYDRDGRVIKISKSEEEKATILENARIDFIEKYKKGQYVIDRVVDDEGNLTELDVQKNRYTMSNMTSKIDSANELYEYKFFKNGKLVYNTKTGKLEGGPKYDTKSAILKELGRGGANVFIASASLLSLGGFFLLAIAPVAAVATLASLAVYPLGASIVHAIKGSIINNRKYNYKDRIEQNRKQLSKEIDEDLSEIYSQTKEVSIKSSYEMLKEHFKKVFMESHDESLRKLKGAELEREIDKKIKELSSEDYLRLTKYARSKYILAFVDRMNKVEEKLNCFASTKYYSDFRIENGKGEVTPENAPLFSKYRAEMLKLEKEIKKLRKAVKRDPSLQTNLELKVEEYKQKSLNYTSLGQEQGRDEKYDAVSEKVYMIKGLIACKEFGDILEEEFDKDLDEKMVLSKDEKEFISHLDYNPSKNVFTYDGKRFSFESIPSKLVGRLGLRNVSEAEHVLNVLIDKLSTYGKALPKYEYEEGNTLIKSKNADADMIVLDKEDEHEEEAHVERVEEEIHEEEIRHEEEAHEEEHRKEKPHEEILKPKSRLTIANLERLLKRIDELNKLDEMYFGPDEDMVRDIDDKIAELEKLIREDLHLLKSAGKSKSDRYVKYKKRIVIAEKMLKDHQILNEKRAKINVGAVI